MIPRFFARHKHIILYGSGLALLLFLLKWLEWRFIILDRAIEIYSGAIAVVFTGLGIWLALKLARPKWKTVVVEKEVYVTREPAIGTAAIDTAIDTPIDERELARLGLSPRELEVLQLMAEGLSNQEIATRLFVSLNTIKTHTGNIFVKLDVRRRTQAVEQARKLHFIR
ncbi:MAG TPA: response regulator transcription factor [Puia sp.]|jgi:DNA-binding CsgD family transcriptional regulator